MVNKYIYRIFALLLLVQNSSDSITATCCRDMAFFYRRFYLSGLRQRGAPHVIITYRYVTYIKKQERSSRDS